MVAAVAVDVAPIADLQAGNLQTILGQIYGKAVYAADGVGSAIYKADLALSRLDTVEGSLSNVSDVAYQTQSIVNQERLRLDSVGGTAQYAADKIGFLDYHLRQIAAQVGYTMPAE